MLISYAHTVVGEFSFSLSSSMDPRLKGCEDIGISEISLRLFQLGPNQSITVETAEGQSWLPFLRGKWVVHRLSEAIVAYLALSNTLFLALYNSIVTRSSIKLYNF